MKLVLVFALGDVEVGPRFPVETAPAFIPCLGVVDRLLVLRDLGFGEQVFCWAAVTIQPGDVLIELMMF